MQTSLRVSNIPWNVERGGAARSLHIGIIWKDESNHALPACILLLWSYGLWDRLVYYVVTNISEKCAASIYRVETTRRRNPENLKQSKESLGLVS
jgi:hypothetical protein